jgi:hypothetical protein
MQTRPNTWLDLTDIIDYPSLSLSAQLMVCESCTETTSRFSRMTCVSLYYTNLPG